MKLGLLPSSLGPVISELSVMNTSQGSFSPWPTPFGTQQVFSSLFSRQRPASLLNRPARGTHLPSDVPSSRCLPSNRDITMAAISGAPTVCQAVPSSVINVKAAVPVLHKEKTGGSERLMGPRSHTQVQLAPRILAKDIVSAPRQPDLPQGSCTPPTVVSPPDIHSFNLTSLVVSAKRPPLILCHSQGSFDFYHFVPVTIRLYRQSVHSLTCAPKGSQKKTVAMRKKHTQKVKVKSLSRVPLFATP